MFIEKNTRNILLLVCLLCTGGSGLKAQQSSDRLSEKWIKDSLSRYSSAKTSLQDKAGILRKYADQAQLKNRRSGFLNQLNPDIYVKNEGIFLHTPAESKEWYNITTLGIQLNAAGLPLHFEFAGQYNPVTGYRFGNSNLFKLQSGFLNPHERINFLSGDIDASAIRGEFTRTLTHQGKEIYQQQLNTVEKGVAEKYDSSVQEFISEQNGVEGLLEKKQEELQRAFAIAKSKAEDDIDKKKNISHTDKQSLKKKHTGSLDSLYKTISKKKTELKAVGLNEERISLLNKYFKKQISEEALEHSFVNSYTAGDKKDKQPKFFNALKSFKTGHFGQTVPGNLMNRDLFMKGVDISLNANHIPLRFGIGKRSDMASAKDAMFDYSAFSSPNFVSYLSASIYSFAGLRGKLSIINSSFQSDNNSLNAPILAAQRNNFVVSLSQDMQLKKFGELNVELSRSTNSYSNGGMQVSELNFVRNDALSSFFNTTLEQSLSVGVRHQISLKEAGLSQTVYFNYAGIGYQSPGANGNLNTRMRLGGALRKYLFKNKLTLNVRGDLRNTPISITGNDAWRNHQIQTDASFRLYKRTTLRLSYNNNATNRISDEIFPAFRSEKYQGGVNTSYKVLGKQAFTYVSLGQQHFNNFGTTTSSGKFFTLTIAQNFLLGSKMLSANMFYNREVSDVKMMGNMLNADVSYQFNIIENLVMIPGITYLDNTGIARQIGVKNSVQYTGSKHFSFGGSADIRRNFYDPLFPQLYSTHRAEINITYYLKNKR